MNEPGRHAVLLFHGLKSNRFELRSVAKALEQAGHPVVIPEIPGYTDLPVGTPAGRWTTWLAHALQCFDQLAADFDRVSVGGLSSGASLAMCVALARKGRVQSLILLSITLFYDGWATPWTTRWRYIGYYTPLRWFWRVRETEPYGVKNPQLRRFIRQAMQQRQTSQAGAAALPLTGVHEVELMARHAKRHAGELALPTLAIHAREDEITSLRSPRYVLAKMPHPANRLVIVENSYHMITLDNDRRQVAREVCEFLAQDHTPVTDAAAAERQAPSPVGH